MEEGADWISGQGPPPDPRPAGPPPTLGRGLFRLEVLQSLSLAHSKVSDNVPAELAGLPTLDTGRQRQRLRRRHLGGALRPLRSLRDVLLTSNAFSV